MNQNGANGNGMFYRGYNGDTIKKPRMVNPLTDEEREAMKTQLEDDFNLKLTAKDFGVAFCTHKDEKTGTYTVFTNSDGTVTCKQCHQTFNPDVCTSEYVNKATEEMDNILQTLKFLALDLSPEVIRGYFGILPYIKKVPQLYRLVNNSFSRYNTETMFGSVENNPTGQSMFGLMNQLMSPATPVYNQAAMYGAWGTPAGPVPGTPQPNWGAGNPFYAQTQQQQQVATPGMPQPNWGMPTPPVANAQATVGQPVPPVAPVNPATTNEGNTVTQQQKVTL